MDPARAAERLRHILEAIRGIQDTTAGLSRDIVMEHWTLRSAVERGFEIISEAARHVPDELLEKRPDIPWKKIRGIGNVLRHGYDALDHDILWQTISVRLDPLEKAVRGLLAEVEKPSRSSD